MYEIQKNGKTINFARTMGYARDYIREDDPNARKSSRSIAGVDIFTNGMSIIVVDIKPDKEGVITKLNSLISKDSYVDVKGIEVTPAKKEEPAVPEEEYVNCNDTGYVGIIPATEYRVDDLTFPKKGKGRCLHCKKLVGYVGGFPAVNPPDVICD
jgi:hypothetical protein